MSATTTHITFFDLKQHFRSKICRKIGAIFADFLKIPISHCVCRPYEDSHSVPLTNNLIMSNECSKIIFKYFAVMQSIKYNKYYLFIYLNFL